MPVHGHSSFQSLYAGQPPWEIGRPQKAFLDVTDRITGSILDSEFCTGENALYCGSPPAISLHRFAQAEFDITGRRSSSGRAGAEPSP